MDLGHFPTPIFKFLVELSVEITCSHLKSHLTYESLRRFVTTPVDGFQVRKINRVASEEGERKVRKSGSKMDHEMCS